MAYELLQTEIFHNRIADYIAVLLIFCVLFLIVRLFMGLILSRLKKWAEKTTTRLDDFIVLNIEKNIPVLLYYIIFYISIQSLKIPPFAHRCLNVVGLVIISVVMIRSIIAIINYAIATYATRKGAEAVRQQNLAGVMTMVRLVVWALGVIFLLDNLGFKVSAVVTGLGIGGVAVAFASQAILGDLLSFFAILFDRPFEIGDTIQVGDQTGTVEKVGIKTTRLLSVNGEQLIFSNADLTKSCIRNFKRMQSRRVQFTIGVVYEIPPELLRAIPPMLAEIIAGVPGAQFDRAHFVTYGDSALVFEVVYCVTGNDYMRYMDIHQQINMKIKEEFDRRGIEFAYPTQKLYVNNLSAKQ